MYCHTQRKEWGRGRETDEQMPMRMRKIIQYNKSSLFEVLWPVRGAQLWSGIVPFSYGVLLLPWLCRTFWALLLFLTLSLLLLLVLLGVYSGACGWGRGAWRRAQCQAHVPYTQLVAAQAAQTSGHLRATRRPASSVDKEWKAHKDFQTILQGHTRHREWSDYYMCHSNMFGALHVCCQSFSVVMRIENYYSCAFVIFLTASNGYLLLFSSQAYTNRSSECRLYRPEFHLAVNFSHVWGQLYAVKSRYIFPVIGVHGMRVQK